MLTNAGYLVFKNFYAEKLKTDENFNFLMKFFKMFFF